MMEGLESNWVQEMQFAVKHGTLFHDWNPFCHGFSDKNVLCCLRKALHEIQIFLPSQDIPWGQMDHDCHCNNKDTIYILRITDLWIPSGTK